MAVRPINLPPAADLIRFGAFELDLRSRELRKDGRSTGLPEQSIKVLHMLLERPSEVLRREQIRARLWPNDTVIEFDHSINTALRKLRMALGDSADSPRYVETLARRGYRWIGPAAKSARQKVTAGTASQAVEPATSSGEYIGTTEPTADDYVPVISSLAVLPFVNLSGDPTQEYFVDGITDELITRFAHIRGLKVISRTSSMQYKSTRKGAIQIGRELGVEGLVEGTLQLSGQRVRMRAQLIHAASDSHCWAHSYDRELTDILTLESELAQDIAEQVKVHVTSRPSGPMGQPVVNFAAFEHFLRGKHFLYRRDADSLEKAVAHLRQAVEIEPSYASAYAALAKCYFLLAYLSARYREYMPQARAVAESALRFDSTLSEAHTALALVAAYEYNLPETEREHQLAVSLGPNDAAAHQWYASNYLVLVGRFEDANHEMAQAMKLDPASWAIKATWAYLLVCERRYDQARSELNKLIEAVPEYSEAYTWRALILLLQGKHSEALADLDRLRTRANTLRTLAFLGYGLGVAGQRSLAQAVLSELTDQQKQTHVSAWWFALVHLGLGDIDRTLAWLEGAYEEHCVELIGLNSLPMYDPLREHPRFCSLAARVGLPPRRSGTTPPESGSGHVGR